MTYKEALIDSLEKIEISNTEILPLPFSYFVLGIGAIMAMQMAVHNEDLSGALIAKKLAPLQFDIDSIITLTTTSQFLTWLLEQPIPESEDGEIMWYDTKELHKKFNVCFFGKE